MKINVYLNEMSKQYGFYYAIADMRHVLRLLNTNIEQLLSILSTKEIEVFSRYTLPKKRVQWLAGRWAAKNALFNYMMDNYILLDLKSIDIINNNDCSPFIIQYPEICVTISHCYPYCIAVVCQKKIGVDLEKVFTPSPELLKYFYTSKEIESLNSNNPIYTVSELATIYWTRKEAVSKYLKLGMKIKFYKIDTASELVLLPELIKTGIYTQSFVNGQYCVSLAFEHFYDD